MKMKFHFRLLSPLIFSSLLPSLLGLADEEKFNYGLREEPYETAYFKFSRRQTFHPFIKYPPYKRCILPELLYRKAEVVQEGNQEVARGTTGNTPWRIYWDRIVWSVYYFDDAEEIKSWEFQKEVGEPRKYNILEEITLPILLLLAFGIIALLAAFLIFPLLGMLVFHFFFFSIKFLLGNKYLKRTCRYIIIKRQIRKRRQLLRLFQNAGQRPPAFHYTLPRFVREYPLEIMPPELEPFQFEEVEEEEVEGDEEFQKKGVLNTPEFVPVYPSVVHQSHNLTEDMFTYLLKVRQYGMFAAWTHGINGINLDKIAPYKKRNTMRPSDFQRYFDTLSSESESTMKSHDSRTRIGMGGRH